MGIRDRKGTLEIRNIVFATVVLVIENTNPKNAKPRQMLAPIPGKPIPTKVLKTRR